jgi:hypothetical protein
MFNNRTVLDLPASSRETGPLAPRNDPPIDQPEDGTADNRIGVWVDPSRPCFESDREFTGPKLTQPAVIESAGLRLHCRNKVHSFNQILVFCIFVRCQHSFICLAAHSSMRACTSASA